MTAKVDSVPVAYVLTVLVVVFSVDGLRGRERLDATTRILQRCRRSDPEGGVWEAADVEWWWRRPRGTDELVLPVWHDEKGPCAAVSVVDWGDRWQADLFVVPGTVALDEPWSVLVDTLSNTVRTSSRSPHALTTSSSSTA